VTVVLEARHGGSLTLATGDWHAQATAAERRLLAQLDGPVLDLGCGPGRLVAAAAELGMPALGVDASPLAVGTAREQGLPVLHRSVFDRLPGSGRWGCVLLIDGNVGIGGDPQALLIRAAELLRPAGSLVIEVDPPGRPTVVGEARIAHESEVSDWFPWAWVGVDGVDELAGQAGLSRQRWCTEDDRWFAVVGLTRGGSR